jgi:formamidopyrimidine-DNA glycosylase
VLTTSIGWLNIKGEETHYGYRQKTSAEPEEWPPKFWKWTLETTSNPPVLAAFVDSRRFGRIRLVDCEASDILNVTPLRETGPDPYNQKEIVTLPWIQALVGRKGSPIKAVLLDQTNIAGIGNWIADEVLYHAKIHPEQYANTLNDKQVKALHNSIHEVCDHACSVLGDSEKFPSDWLFNHRWGKGKKDAAKTLPSGEALDHITVGGRTSCFVPSVQKKTGPVAGNVTKEVALGKRESKQAESKIQKTQEKEMQVKRAKEKVNGVGRPKGSTKPVEGESRGRGRPKKEVTEDKPTKSSGQGRGRPRKEAVEEKPKAAGRGRPRKDVAEEPKPKKAKTTAASTEPRKKRGRPKKESTEDASEEVDDDEAVAEQLAPRAKKARKSDATKTETPGRRKSGRTSLA